jgi:hypothetical protein
LQRLPTPECRKGGAEIGAALPEVNGCSAVELVPDELDDGLLNVGNALGGEGD